MEDKRVYLMQVGLKSLGFDPGGLDGDEGPKTRAAYAAWESSLYPNGTVAKRIVEIARTQVGIREETKNRGEGIAKYWTATSYLAGYTNREPYCAAFICWLVKEATKDTDIKFSLPKSPVAYDFEKWGAANTGKGVNMFSNSTMPKAGDIFTLRTASHVGLVVKATASTITTIEANTDGSGSREGDGVYERTRPISSVRKFVRILE